MNELKNVSTLVKSILTEDERARNTDNYLYLRVLEHYSGIKGTDIHTMTVPVFLKELNQALGKETIDTFNTSDTRGNSPSYGTNYQKLGKDLASVDELAVLDGGKCILQLRGVRPFLSDKYDLTQHPNYKYTSDYDKKNEFDIEKFLSRRLKLKANDEYEVVESE